MGDWDVEKLKKIVEEELKCFNENESPDKSELPNDEVLEKLHQAIKDSSLFQHSYSSIDKKSSGIEIESIDGIPQNVSDEPVETEESETVNEISDYPRGNLYGDALHHIFEKLDFVEIGKMPLDNAQSDLKLKQLVTDSFLSQGLPIGRHPDWMTNQKTGESFKLNELDSNKRRAEMEFRLKANEKGGVVADRLKTFCKGFMDLVFVREDNSGCPYYSVLDWKSNLLAKYDSVASFEAVRDHYSIQMVLYSYCLIQWLSCIMHKDPKAVFNENFGGIYYVFARGCKEDEGDGIYAHTWESFDKLKSAYEELEGKMYE